MNNGIHSHWDSTDDDELPVRITDARSKKVVPKKESTPNIPRAQRSPAAIVGVGLFLAAGTALFMGAQGLLGQIATDDIEVLITEDGIEPSVITVMPGETITWSNLSDIPHILRSDTLPTEDDEPFNTTAIFPEGDFSFVVPLTAEAGTYDYISSTSASITGQIIIEEGAMGEEPDDDIQTHEDLQEEMMQQIMAGEEISPDPVVSSSASSVSALNTIEYGNVPASSAQSSSDQVIAAAIPGVIPQNPNTVAHSLNPLPVRQQSSSKAAAQTPLHAAAITQHKPLANAQSGMELWVLGAITLASLAGVTWKARKYS